MNTQTSQLPMLRNCCALLIFLCVNSFYGIAQNSIWYVSAKATNSTPDGKSWNTAFRDLQPALQTAEPNDQIWISEGTYYPTTTTDRYISFMPKQGVKIYGSFKGNETTINQRVMPSIPTTILSGNIGNPNDSLDNSYNVFKLIKPKNNVLDGLTVTKAYNNEIFYDSSLLVIYDTTNVKGAAIFIDNSDSISSFSIKNCLVTQNRSFYNGSAIFCTQMQNAVNIDIQNCQLIDNALFRVNKRGWEESNKNTTSIVINQGMVNINNCFLKLNSILGENNSQNTFINFNNSKFKNSPIKLVSKNSLKFTINACDFDSSSIISKSFSNDFEINHSTFRQVNNDSISIVVSNSLKYTSNCLSNVDVRLNIVDGKADVSIDSSKNIAVTVISKSKNQNDNYINITNSLAMLNITTSMLPPKGKILLSDVSLINVSYFTGNTPIIMKNCKNIGANKVGAIGIYNCNATIEIDRFIMNNTYNFNNLLAGLKILQIINCPNVLLKNSLFISSYQKVEYYPFHLTNSKVIITNSTFCNNSVDKSTKLITLYESELTILNSIFDKQFSNCKNIIYSSRLTDTIPNKLTIHNCIIDEANDSAIIAQNNKQFFPAILDLKNNIYTSNPMFRDTAAHDYRLSPCSPAINVGDNSVISSDSTDLAGNPRIQHGKIDIGAYEFGGFKVQAVRANPQYCGYVDGSFLPTYSNECGQIQYQWKDQHGNSGTGNTNLLAGQYKVTITDSNGCTDTTSVTIPQGLGHVPTSVNIINNINSLDNQGAIAIQNVTGGTPPYRYQWSNGATTAEIQNLKSGAYTVTITDAKGCTYTNTYSVKGIVANKDITLANSVNIFPNPSHEVLHLQFENNAPLYNHYTILNSNGQALLSGSLNIENGISTLHTESLTAGMYILTLDHTATGEKQYVKFVKQ